MVLRQEDGAVRPEKNIALETHQRVETKRNAKDTRTERLARPEEKVDLDTLENKTELSAQRKTQPCCAETKRNANLTRNERIARLEEEVILDTLVKKIELSAQKKIQPRFACYFGISEEMPYSRLR